MSNTQKLTHAAERVHITVMVDTVRFVQKPRPRDSHLSNTTNRALQHWRCSLQGWWKKVGLGCHYLVLGRAPVLVHRGELLEEALRDEGCQGDVAPVLLALLLGVLRALEGEARQPRQHPPPRVHRRHQLVRGAQRHRERQLLPLLQSMDYRYFICFI